MASLHHFAKHSSPTTFLNAVKSYKLLNLIMCRTTYEYEDKNGDCSAFEQLQEAEDEEEGCCCCSCSCFPADEVDALHHIIIALDRPLPVLHRIPTACGILKNLQLVGVFPTARWLTDPTMPPDVKELFGGTPFFALGEYRVAHLDVLDALGRIQPLTLIVNKGVEGLMTGYWGGAFARYPPNTCWARFENSGELETTVKEQCKVKKGKTLWIFEEFEGVEFSLMHFESGALPGICHTQLERLLGIAVQFVFDMDWNIVVPESLIEIRDRSSRFERLQRARSRRMATTPRTLIHEKAFDF